MSSFSMPLDQLLKQPQGTIVRINGAVLDVDFSGNKNDYIPPISTCW